jgi:hypothetical protein
MGSSCAAFQDLPERPVDLELRLCTSTGIGSSLPFALPRGEQRLDVAPLLLAELELREATPRLVGIVVRDRSLEALPQRRRLRELAAKPAEEAYRVRPRRGHSFFT